MEDNGLEFLLDAVDRFPLCEEFANILDHGDPVPLAVLSWNCATSVESADSNVGSGCGQRVGGVSQVASRERAARQNPFPSRMSALE